MDEVEVPADNLLPNVKGLAVSLALSFSAYKVTVFVSRSLFRVHLVV